MEEKEIPISKEQMKFYKVDGSHVFDLVMEIDKLQQENKELRDNWNELKEYLNTNTAIFHDEVDMFQVWKTFKAVLDKMKYLEGDK